MAFFIALLLLMSCIVFINFFIIFYSAEKLKAHFPVLLATPMSTDNSCIDRDPTNKRDRGVSVLSYLNMIREVSPGAFIVASDKYRVISAYAVYCLLDSVRRHCDSLLAVVAIESSSNRSALEEVLAHSCLLHRVVRFVLPVAANENNPNIFLECVKVLQCGAQHFRSLSEFCSHKQTSPSTPLASALDSSAALGEALTTASFELLFYRSMELHPQKLLHRGLDTTTAGKSSGEEERETDEEGELHFRWDMYATVPALGLPVSPSCSGETGADVDSGLDYVTLRRTTNSILCASEAFLCIAAECSRTPPCSLSSSFIRQPVRIHGISVVDEYFQFVSTEPVVSVDRYLNSNSCKRGSNMNWRGREVGTDVHRSDSEVVVSSYFGLLLGKCVAMFRHEDPATAPASAPPSFASDNSMARDAQDKLRAAQHRALLAICQVVVHQFISLFL